jgi:hypothetical protein
VDEFCPKECRYYYGFDITENWDLKMFKPLFREPPPFDKCQRCKKKIAKEQQMINLIK